MSLKEHTPVIPLNFSLFTTFPFLNHKHLPLFHLLYAPSSCTSPSMVTYFVQTFILHILIQFSIYLIFIIWFLNFKLSFVAYQYLQCCLVVRILIVIVNPSAGSDPILWPTQHIFTADLNPLYHLLESSIFCHDST